MKVALKHKLYRWRENWAKGINQDFIKGCIKSTMNMNWMLAIFNNRQQILFYQVCEYMYTPTRISLEKQKVRKAKEWQGEWKHAKQCDSKQVW